MSSPWRPRTATNYDTWARGEERKIFSLQSPRWKKGELLTFHERRLRQFHEFNLETWRTHTTSEAKKVQIQNRSVHSPSSWDGPTWKRSHLDFHLKRKEKKGIILRGFFFFSLAKCLSSIQLPHYYNASRNKTPILRAATTISPFTNVRNVPGSFCSGATDPPPRQRKGDDSFFFPFSPLLSATAQRSGWMRGRRTTKWAKKGRRDY